MSKFNLVLAGVAVVQIILLLVIGIGGNDHERAPVEPQPLVDFDLKAVGSIEISNPGEDEAVEIARKDDAWVVSSADDFPARVQQILDDPKPDDPPETHWNGILNKLAKIEVRRPVLRKKKNQNAVKVADDRYEKRVTIRDRDGEELAQLYVARGASGRSSYVRRAGEDEVYETDGLSSWDLSSSVSSWVNVTYVDIEKDDVRSITAKLGDTTITFERREKPAEKKDDAETPEDEDAKGAGDEKPEAKDDAEKKPEYEWWLTAPVEGYAKQSKADDVLRRLSNISLADVAGRKAPEAGGFDAPPAVYTVKMKDGKEHVITIGKQIDDGDYYLKSADSDWYVQVSSWSVKALVELKLEDAQDEKPEPEAPEKPESPKPDGGKADGGGEDG